MFNKKNTEKKEANIMSEFFFAFLSPGGSGYKVVWYRFWQLEHQASSYGEGSFFHLEAMSRKIVGQELGMGGRF